MLRIRLEHGAKNMEHIFAKAMLYFKVLDRPDVRQAGARRSSL